MNEQRDPHRLDRIRRDLERVLADVRAAVTDWRAMREAKSRRPSLELEKLPPPLPAEEIHEARDFLAWMGDDNFTFLGYRDYDFLGEDDQARTSILPGTGLGILRDDSVSVFDRLRNIERLPPDVRYFLRQSRLLMVTKANRRATVHRPVQMDTIGVKRFDADGTVIGEHLFVGLFTSVAYNRSPREIPLLRRKVEAVIERAGFDPASHDGKALLHILETFPRDELFQIAEDELFDIALGILHLQERQRIALFVRRDPFERFVSCLVYLPRDRYNTDLRLRIQAILAEAFDGTLSAFYTPTDRDGLARLQFVIDTTPGAIPDVDLAELEEQLVEAGRSWTDLLQEALIEAHGEEQGLALLRRYADAFPVAYRERFNARRGGARHRPHRGGAGPAATLALNLYRPIEAAGPMSSASSSIDGGAQVRALRRAADAGAYGPQGARPRCPSASGPATPATAGLARTISGWSWPTAASRSRRGARRLPGRLRRVWAGEMEDDGFNRLVLAGRSRLARGQRAARLCQISAPGRHRLQPDLHGGDARRQCPAGAPADRAAVPTLASTPPRQATAAPSAARINEREIAEALDAVANLDEDRILRRFLNLVAGDPAHQLLPGRRQGKPTSPSSSTPMRWRSCRCPRPLCEIFVYSPRVEGVHLRGGKVARGGIRWSDRREDFRTEVLGLMKAQMVKNAVIVPVGSKGGFVVKRPPADGGREALAAEGDRVLQDLHLRGLLDITDNLVDGQGGAARRTSCATTATIPISSSPPTRARPPSPTSPTASPRSTASGWATPSPRAARPATTTRTWASPPAAPGRSVKRHFRELGTDIQTRALHRGRRRRHVGRRVRQRHAAVAADPAARPPSTTATSSSTPTPTRRSRFAERQRLFDLPRSSWADYDQKLISPGGGVFAAQRRSRSRSSAEARARAGHRGRAADARRADPARSSRRRSTCSGSAASAPTSRPAPRPTPRSATAPTTRSASTAASCACKVVGEGANLGFTQRGRIEFALAGGRINTDAIDNSAGVDCSDHEVNIKILLGRPGGRRRPDREAARRAAGR